MLASSQFLITLGSILLLGLITSELGRRTFLPCVPLLLIFGAIIGKDVLDSIPLVFSDRFEIIADMALLMVGFLLGGKLTIKSFNKSGGQIFWMSLINSCTTYVKKLIKPLINQSRVNQALRNYKFKAVNHI